MCAVEWKKLGEIAEYRRGSFPQPYGNKEWYDGEGAMPFVQVADVEESGVKLKESTKQFISTLAMPMSVFVPLGSVVVTLQGSIGKVAITQYDSYVDRTLGIFTNYSKNIDKKYFAHQLLEIFSVKKKTARGGTIKTITKEEFSQFEIPIPSLAKQQEIVSHLDTFTTLISNLESELDMRRKQYEHYRNQLLDFEGVEGVEWKTLGETCTLKARIGWQGLTKKEYRDKGEYLLVTGTDFTDAHTIDFEHCVYVDKERYEQDINIQLKNGDVLITKDGTLGKVAYINSLPKPTTLNGGVFVVRDTTSKISQKYLMYYLVSGYFKHFIEHNHTNGTIKHLTQGLLVNFTIPIPSKQTQQEIVEKLDAFENLIQSFEQEIKLRKQQYEYYREKLLTFEKE